METGRHERIQQATAVDDKSEDKTREKLKKGSFEGKKNVEQ